MTNILNKNKQSFDEWYKSLSSNKNDTTSYNLRRAYELAPQKDLDNFKNKSNAHLNSIYWNEKDEGEFMKSKDHPTLNKELEFYNGNSKNSKKFRQNYILDSSENYFKYLPIIK